MVELLRNTSRIAHIPMGTQRFIPELPQQVNAYLAEGKLLQERNILLLASQNHVYPRQRECPPSHIAAMRINKYTTAIQRMGSQTDRVEC